MKQSVILVTTQDGGKCAVILDSPVLSVGHVEGDEGSLQIYRNDGWKVYDSTASNNSQRQSQTSQQSNQQDQMIPQMPQSGSNASASHTQQGAQGSNTNNPGTQASGSTTPTTLEDKRGEASKNTLPVNTGSGQQAQQQAQGAASK